MSAGRVVVIGGGLAGIAAALDCADAGAAVTLVEVRPRLGGAAYSFARDDLQLDNGQHVFLRCCVAYRALLSRLGSEHRVSVQERLRIPVISPGGQMTTIARNGLPAPLHLAGAMLGYRRLRPARRLSAVLAAGALSRLDPDDPRLDEQTLGRWLASFRQGSRELAELWDLVALPTLNVPAREASLGLAAFVLQRGLLKRADAGDIGFHERPLGETIGEPALAALAAAGVEVRLGWRAKAIEVTATGVVARDADGEEIDARAAIVAVAHRRAAALMEPLDPALSDRLRRLGVSPIVNLHVVYDRRVTDLRFAAGAGSPVQYLFDRSSAGGVPEDRQYLAISLSAADREMAMSVDELRERYLPALGELLPRARHAGVERFLVTREHAATFRATPGSRRLRAGTRTAAPNVLLAGSWTDTGWPATLEGAVMSGHRAAREAIDRLDLTAAGNVVDPAGSR